MNQVLLYSKYNGLQKNDAAFVIENFLNLIKFKNEEKILDVGCGDGSVLKNLLIPKLPKNLKIIGVDVSDEMLKFAKENHHCENIMFIKYDISSNYIPIDLKENFNHILSFYCLHWVVHQRQALKNLHSLLKPDGDILLTFLAKNPIYDIYYKLSQSNRWSKYMENVQNCISPYHYCDNPEKVLEQSLKDAGFRVHICRTENRLYEYANFDILKKAISAVDPFIKNIPDNEIKYYIMDYFRELKNIKNIFIENCNNNNNEEKIRVIYKLFIVYATKT